SAGKRTGTADGEMGNGHLEWAFREAAALMTRHVSAAKALAAGKAKAHGKGNAQAILAAKLGRAVYAILSRGVPFDEGAFMKRDGHGAAARSARRREASGRNRAQPGNRAWGSGRASSALDRPDGAERRRTVTGA